MPVLVALAAAALASAHAWFIVPRLPEPVDHSPDDPAKPAYRELVTPRNLAWLMVLSLVCGQVAWLVPPAQWPLWIVYTGAVGTLVGIDALTTYLPRRLHYLCLAELALALALVGTLAGWDAVARAVGGGLAAGALFWLVWRFSRSFGFGDVRLVTLVGAIAATTSWTMWLQALLLGTIVGALWGIIAAVRAKSRDAVFPYGPALWLGPYLAVMVNALTG